MSPITIIGGGPAGSAAALSARSQGAAVRLFEKSTFPRHKVCGEFISPGAREVLEDLGVWNAFEECGPPRISRVALAFGARHKQWRLSEPGFGMSRFQFDNLLLNQARERGAEVIHGHGEPAGATIVAHGRRESARGARLFGFKAHFEGPADDAVSLYFFKSCYVGVSSVEGGRTNVCGLAPESVLRPNSFEIDPILVRNEPLFARIRPLSRVLDWMITGPLVFGQRFDSGAAGEYPVGDALGFIDPFTGSGMLGALITGQMAGRAAARGVSPEEYLGECRTALRGAYRAAAVFRAALRTGVADWLGPLIPGPVLLNLTRPKYTSGNEKNR